jgi:hypothetical protein
VNHRPLPEGDLRADRSPYVVCRDDEAPFPARRRRPYRPSGCRDRERLRKQQPDQEGRDRPRQRDLLERRQLGASRRAAGQGRRLRDRPGRVFKQLEPIVAKEVSQLRKLPRPSIDKALLNRYIDSVTKAGDVYKQLAAAAQCNDIPGVAKYLGELRASPAQSLAQRYGMSQCAAAAGAAAP